ncbi:hypothetical protein KSP40_PGU001834 [Platanthera guangdongensis]|uniref:Malectin-like domain-containing protein n=1 Tax=Platanthera guangdongensis TaxID=2320717 RepID=A0ABR2MA17_9ASPA
MVSGLCLHLHRRISKHLIPWSPFHTIHLTLFPGAGHPRRKFCHIIPSFRGSRYLICTTYFYDGINVPGDPLVFDQIVDGTFWIIVNTTADYVAGTTSSYEGVFMARGTKMRVCLAGNDYTDSDPFMNIMEMIVLADSIYNSTDFRKKAFGLITRSSFGYDGPIVRYGFPVLFFEFD